MILTQPGFDSTVTKSLARHFRTGAASLATAPEGAAPMEFDASAISFVHPSKVYGATTVRGQGARTLIKSRNGGEAFRVATDYAPGNNSCNKLTIENLNIDSDGMGIAVDPTLAVIERLVIRNVTFNCPNAWAISLRPLSRCYFVTLEDCDFTNCWGVLDANVIGLSIRNCRMQGQNRSVARPPGMINLTGSCTIEGAAGRLEGAWGCPLVCVRPYLADDGVGLYDSTLSIRDVHVEPNDPGMMMDLERTVLIAPYLMQASERTWWRLKGCTPVVTAAVPSLGVVTE